MKEINVVELPGKKGKTRKVYRVDIAPTTSAGALAAGMYSYVHCEKIHTYDYENGYVEFMSETDAEIYVQSLPTGIIQRILSAFATLINWIRK